MTTNILTQHKRALSLGVIVPKTTAMHSYCTVYSCTVNSGVVECFTFHSTDWCRFSVIFVRPVTFLANMTAQYQTGLESNRNKEQQAALRQSSVFLGRTFNKKSVHCTVRSWQLNEIDPEFNVIFGCCNWRLDNPVQGKVRLCFYECNRPHRLCERRQQFRLGLSISLFTFAQ